MRKPGHLVASTKILSKPSASFAELLGLYPEVKAYLASEKSPTGRVNIQHVA
jgi:hypothetical protein